MEIRWSKEGWEDYLYWQEADREILRKINEILRDITRSPFTGLGKPEPLRGELSGWWSRRISEEHRLVYRIRGQLHEQFVQIMMCRHHYGRKSRR